MKLDEAMELVKENSGREVAICALVGSRNYGLDTEGSDYDFKSFVIPSLEDMYEYKEYFKEVKGDEYEIKIHDLRKLPDLLWKSNPSYLDVIFARKRFMCDPMHDLLYENRERIAGMNLPYLYNSSIGIFHNKMKYLEKGTINTQRLIERYGYDTKQAMHAHRMLFVVRWFADEGKFEKALRYDDPVTGESRRKFFLGIKNGKHSLDDIRTVLEKLLIETEEHYRDRYLNKVQDKEMELMVKNRTKEFILGRLRDHG